MPLSPPTRVPPTRIPPTRVPPDARQPATILKRLLWGMLLFNSSLWANTTLPRILNPDYTGAKYFAPFQQAVIWGSDGVIAISRDGERWQQVNTPTTAEINDVALFSAGSAGEDPTYVLAGDGGTLLQSSAAGAWQDLAAGLPQEDFTGFLQRAHGQQIVTGSSGLLAHRAAGSQPWQVRQLNGQPRIHAIAETQGKTVIIAGEQGLLATSNDGLQWQFIATGTTATLYAVREAGPLLIVPGDAGIFFWSRNNGNDWQRADTGIAAAISDAAYSPASQTLLVTSANGEYVTSLDQGEHWHHGLITDSAADSAGQALLEDRARQAPETGTGTGAGTPTWTGTGATTRGQANIEGQALGIPEANIKGQALGIPFGITNVSWSATLKRFIATGHGGKTALSDTHGKHWQVVPSRGATGALHHLRLPLREERLIGFGRGGDLRTALPEQAKALAWQPVTAPLDGYYRVLADTPSHWFALSGVGDIVLGKTADYLRFRPTYPNPQTPPQLRTHLHLGKTTHLAAGPTGAILKSDDDGRSWRAVLWTDFAANHAFTQLLQNPVDQSLIALEASGRCFRSTDQGEHWQALNAIGNPLPLWRAAASDRGTVIAVGQRGGIARLTAGSHTWQYQSAAPKADLYAVRYHTAEARFYAVGSEGTLVFSDDDGKRWQQITSPTTATLLDLAFTPTGTRLAFGQQQVILRAASQSNRWSQVRGPAAGELRRSLQPAPNGYQVLIGNSGLVLVSDDDGRRWRRLPLGTNAAFRTGLYRPATHELILAGERLVVDDRTFAPPPPSSEAGSH